MSDTTKKKSSREILQAKEKEADELRIIVAKEDMATIGPDIESIIEKIEDFMSLDISGEEIIFPDAEENKQDVNYAKKVIRTNLNKLIKVTYGGTKKLVSKTTSTSGADEKKRKGKTVDIDQLHADFKDNGHVKHEEGLTAENCILFAFPDDNAAKFQQKDWPLHVKHKGKFDKHGTGSDAVWFAK